MVFVELASRMGAVVLWLVLLGRAGEWQEGVVLCSRCCWGELANGKRGRCCVAGAVGESWRMAGGAGAVQLMVLGRAGEWQDGAGAL